MGAGEGVGWRKLRVVVVVVVVVGGGGSEGRGGPTCMPTPAIVVTVPSCFHMMTADMRPHPYSCT